MAVWEPLSVSVISKAQMVFRNLNIVKHSLHIIILGYKIAKRDRTDGRKGGGSLIYFAEDLNAHNLSELSSNSSLEAAWIDFSIPSDC